MSMRKYLSFIAAIQPTEMPNAMNITFIIKSKIKNGRQNGGRLHQKKNALVLHTKADKTAISTDRTAKTIGYVIPNCDKSIRTFDKILSKKEFFI